MTPRQKLQVGFLWSSMFHGPQTVLEIAITPVFTVHETNAVEISLTDIKVAVHCLARIPAAEVRNHTVSQPRLARFNLDWPYVAGEADIVSPVSASACHIGVNLI